MKHATFAKRHLLAASVLCGSIAAAAQGATIVTFAPAPSSPSVPELSWAASPAAAPYLTTGSGSIGNGDGGLGSSQMPGGLQVDTPFVIPGVWGSSINAANGSTTFYDVTLELGGLAANGSAGAAGGLVYQNLFSGTFSLYSSQPGSGPTTLLLAGTIDSAIISGMDQSQVGGMFSASVKYTDGVIYNALMAAGGKDNGDLSWSLREIAPQLGIDGGTQYLAAFNADATGQFGAAAVPEPSAAVLGIAGLALLARRRKA